MDGKELCRTLAKENTPEYNMMKMIEECTELNEVLIKKLNKKGRKKEPALQDIIDEMGDVFVRLRILSEMMGYDDVQKRINFKLAELMRWYESGNFKANC